MQHTVTWSVLTYVLTGLAYTICLLANVPLFISIFISLLIGFIILILSVLRNNAAEGNFFDTKKYTVIIFLGFCSCFMIKAHGAHDAWAHWLPIARYFSSNASFSFLSQPYTFDHADYPPGLSAPIGLIWGVIGSYPEWVSRSISFLFYLSLVLLLCDIATRSRQFPNLWLFVLAVFTLNFECISQGLNQYADVPLSLCLVLFFIWSDVAKASGSPRTHVLCGLLIGCCLFMKNEGALISLSILVLFGREWIKRKQLLNVMIGLLPFVIVLIWYKSFTYHVNDLVNGFDQNSLSGLFNLKHYRYLFTGILYSFRRFPLPIIFLVWALFQLRGRMGLIKSKKLFVLLLIYLGYIFIYLTSGNAVQWLLNTSYNRLLMQLWPSLIYILIQAILYLENNKKSVLSFRDADSGN